MTSLQVIHRAVYTRNCKPPSDQSDSMSQHGHGTKYYIDIHCYHWYIFIMYKGLDPSTTTLPTLIHWEYKSTMRVDNPTMSWQFYRGKWCIFTPLCVNSANNYHIFKQITNFQCRFQLDQKVQTKIFITKFCISLACLYIFVSIQT